MMKTVQCIGFAAIVGLAGASFTASAWWGGPGYGNGGPGYGNGNGMMDSMGDMFGDGRGDFNMSMGGSGRSYGRGNGYGNGYGYGNGNQYGSPYGYGAPYGGAPYGGAPYGGGYGAPYGGGYTPYGVMPPQMPIQQ